MGVVYQLLFLIGAFVVVSPTIRTAPMNLLYRILLMNIPVSLRSPHKSGFLSKNLMT